VNLPGLPGLLGMTGLVASAERVALELRVRPDHLAATGYLHAGTVVAMADTACGYGCLAALPPARAGFTTIELKSNHLATAGVGELLTVVATPAHLGRTTQVWDAAVAVERDRGDRTVGLFRCTQLLLDPARWAASSTVAATGCVPTGS